MSTPWSIEFDQNILGVVQNDILVGMCDNHGDRSILFLWDRFRLDAGLELAVDKVLDKCRNFLFGQFVAVEGVFFILDGLLDCESGPFISWKI